MNGGLLGSPGFKVLEANRGSHCCEWQTKVPHLHDVHIVITGGWTEDESCHTANRN